MRNCPLEVKAKCYNAFVRPIAEYASCVWDPHTHPNITKLESIQRQAARFVMNDYSRENSVSAMLDELNWDSLQHRRAVSKVTMMHRITNGLIGIPQTQLKPLETPTRGNSRRFHISNSRTTMMKGTFFPDTSHLWNTLPQHVVDSPSTDDFKARAGDVTFY
ncbi:uncharacterized protein [Amphiura filiformis]|uniref:uncharacterized protein n=1 Tax=Amphiura filiformis TaxID=82378 RepID=UPI003B2182CA